ncbi:hypothetical protein [Pararhodospirillum photometricum]|uniref:hypothetical protein n=1 Tax=Pararhodospirillum photometricum TaxID=1084 RepID=UPI0012FEA33C|nr:hypothetical protein [Pararhodospirillum photometricum]
MSESLVPAGKGAAILEAAKIGAALGSPPGVVPKAYADAMAEALEALPPDLLALAGKRARTTLRFPPRPAEVVALVSDELALRRRVKVQADYALFKAEREPPPAARPSPAKARSVAALVAGAVNRPPREPLTDDDLHAQRAAVLAECHAAGLTARTA